MRKEAYVVMAQLHLQLSWNRVAFEKRLNEAGLVEPEFLALLVLASQEREMALGELAKAMRSDRMSIQAPLDNLESRGFIVRRRDPADKRRVLVELAFAGWEWLEPLTADLLLGLLRGTGMSLLRALRAALIEAKVPETARPPHELQTWRSASSEA